ncbi:MAG TPA: hypothetical protein VF331_04805 [Polyangiales bacterium]
MANTQRPPPPLLQPPVQSDDLDALSDALDSGAPPPPAAAAPSAVRPIVRGNDDEVLDLSALAKLGASTPPPAGVRASVAPRLSESTRPQLQLDEEPIVLPRRARATWVMPLLIGLGCGVGLSAVWFATSGGGDHAAAPAQQVTPAVASAAPAPPEVPAPAPSAPTAAPAPPPAAVAVPQPLAAAQVPAAAPSVADAAKSMRETAAPAAMERSVPKTTPSTLAAATAYARPSSSREPPLSPPNRYAATSLAAPAAPVLVVRPAAEPAPAPVGSSLQPMAAPPSVAEPPPTSAATAAATAAPATRPGGGAIDALLDSALSPDARHAETVHAESSPSAAVLPLAPSREDVVSAVSAVQSAVRGCAMGQAGSAAALLSVRNDGRVSSAQITGAPFAGTAAGRCMEGALRSAHFPRFKQPTFSVQYPFSIQ